MKLLANSKLLCALLAATSVGLGVQTFYLIKVHRQLDETATRAAEVSAASAANAPDEGEDSARVHTRTLLDPIDSFAELARAEERMRGFMDDFERDYAGPWFDDHPRFFDGAPAFWNAAGLVAPSIDLQDRGADYEVTVEVPGAEQADVLVRVEGGMLVVEGSRETTTEESEPGRYLRRASHLGRFERRLALPQDADGSTLRSELESGVLKVTLQKRS